MDRGVIVSAELGGSLNGSYETFLTHLLFLRQDPYTTAIGLFRVGLGLQDMSDVVFDKRIDPGGPANELVGVPFANKLMRRGKMLLMGRIAIGLAFPHVMGDPLLVTEYRYMGR